MPENKTAILKDQLVDKPYFCSAPFTQLVQDYMGRGGPCPYNSGEFPFYGVPIKDRWNHQAPLKLRDQHLAGEKPDFCQRCYKEEAAGFLSRRKIELSTNPYSEADFKNGVYKKGPKTFVIRLSNHCNYACRTCHSLDSSLFKAEGDFYEKHYQQKENRYLQTDARQEFNSNEMEEFFELSSTVNQIDFYGGEPLMNTTHHLLLNKLIKSGRAKEINLSYCTNGSFGPTDVRREMWDKFKSVRFQFSLDGVNKYYHYIRWPGQWDKVEKNILSYTKDLPKEVSAIISSGVNTTVSILNVYYVDEIFDKLSQLIEPNELAHTTVHEPQYYSILNIPERCKLIIAEKLARSLHYNTRFSSIVSYMFSKKCNYKIWDEFVLWTEKKDKYRNVSIQDYLPEFYNIIKPEYLESLGDFRALSKPSTSSTELNL